MRGIDTVKGKGTVNSSKGDTPVDYELRVPQEQISTGLKQIRGWIQPQCCEIGEIAILEFQDGRKLKFYYLTNTTALIQGVFE
jgi:hypothetical protein